MTSPLTSDIQSIFSDDELCRSTEESSLGKENSDTEKCQSEPVTRKHQVLEVVCPPLTNPKSAYEGESAPSKIVKERHAVNSLLIQNSEDTYQDFEGSAFISFTLDDFTIYRREIGGERCPGMVALNEVTNREGNGIFFFDGILRSETDPNANAEPLYLQQVSFSIVSIGGYEDLDTHTVGEDIWIQSNHCQHRGDIWYRLGKPSAAYASYHNFSVWLADFAKHFVDYLHAEEHVDVTLGQFRTEFCDWLVERHQGDATFTSWLNAYKSRDFRHAVNAHAKFLRGQAFTVDIAYSNHQLWDELGISQTPIIKEQPKVIKETVVTPFVYKCFRNMPWFNHLKQVQLAPDIEKQHQQLVTRQTALLEHKVKRTSETGDITIGDVIALKHDQGSIWKEQEELWYGLVQGFTKHGSLRFIWLYRPGDTLCAKMTYPYENELFLSDHCNCNEGETHIDSVVKKVSVEFFSFCEDRSDSVFFVRQTYRTKDDTFKTLTGSDFICGCDSATIPSSMFTKGDTVLVDFSGKLEPAEIVELAPNKAIIRVFLRRGRDLGEESCRPNELVYNDNVKVVPMARIQRPCHIRVYQPSEINNIPCPYNRDGSGDAFYVLFRRNGRDLAPMKMPVTFKQGFDPSVPIFPKLKALNLFSGGGTLDRGLEEGTAIESKWAVEWGLPQMLTYRANHPNGENLKLFCGSVNDYLFQAIRGKENDILAKLGEVEFLSAGSPCQGYSSANAHKQSEESMRNSSMITSVASYVDLYRPQYAILENVTLMASRRHEQNPLSQLLCAFVGMGYQTRVFNLDAWSFGAPQSRSRLFIVIAAPGKHIPEHPHLTHSHPTGTPRRALGDAPSGLSFGERRWETPVFDFVSASTATRDLPQIDTARIMSIPWPDHRPSRTESETQQSLIRRIPKLPRAQGLLGAFARGWASCTDYSARIQTPGSKAWSRVHPEKLFPTVTTTACPYCKFTGRWLHWQEDRVITVQEVRRAQGFPDSEVLIGTTPQQWKIVGNSVARQVALSLGLSMREACLRNLNEHPTRAAFTSVTRSEKTRDASLTFSIIPPTTSAYISLKRRHNSVAVPIAGSSVERLVKRRTQLYSQFNLPDPMLPPL